jgi:hypothetical protein
MRIKLAGFLIIALSLAGMVFFAPKADAGYCDVARGCIGFFTGNRASASVGTVFNIFPAGLYAGSANEFINTIESRLNGGGQSQMGAAFVINVMMGNGPFNTRAAGISKANADKGNWEDLVRAYANNPPAGYGIRWNVMRNSAVNSAYFSDINDDAFHEDTHGSRPVIEFFWPGGHLWIQRSCGNLLGSVRLPTPPPPNHPPTGSFTVTCDPDGSNTVHINRMRDQDANPNTNTTGRLVIGNGNGRLTRNVPSEGIDRVFTIDDGLKPFQQQNITFYVRDVKNGNKLVQVDTGKTRIGCLTGTGCAGSDISPDGIDTATRFSITVSIHSRTAARPPGTNRITLTITPNASTGATWSATVGPAGVNGEYDSSSQQFTHTFANLGPTGSAGQYNYTYSYVNGNDSSLNRSCNGSFLVAATPYVSVYGGDALAGVNETNGRGFCDVNTDAGFLTWNNGAPGYNGAGAEFAVTALGPINGFASALNASTGGNPRKPVGLSFANSAGLTNAPGGLFGGQFSAGSPIDDSSCNFTADMTAAPAATVQNQINSLPNDASGNNVVNGQKEFYATGGNVFISQSIIYNQAGWANVSDIPTFKLVVVGGDIIIQNDVNQLDGLYVAEPDDLGNGGHIITCGDPTTSSAADVSDEGFYDLCNHRLVINGAFAAKQIWFMRSFGTVGAAVNNATNEANAAEVFHYGPEMWLPRKPGASIDYNSISGLPPVL